MKELDIDYIKTVAGGKGRPDERFGQTISPRTVRNAVIGFLGERAVDRVMEGLNSVARDHAANVASRQRSGSIKPGENSMSDAAANQARGTGGHGSGASRVICTYFFRKGMLDQEIWRADMEFTFKHLSQTTVRGYHVWAIPYVRLMRKSPLAEKIMRPIAIWRAEELAYKTGVLQKGNWKGKVVRAILEPICFAIGLFAKEQNWESLWTQAPKATPVVENTPAA